MLKYLPANKSHHKHPVSVAGSVCWVKENQLKSIEEKTEQRVY